MSGHTLFDAAGARRWRRELALHDRLLAAYYAVLAGALLRAGPAPGRARTLAGVVALAALTAAAVWAARRGARPSPLATLAYRAGTVGGVAASYFLLRDLLPIVSPGSYDHALRALDGALFGTDPVLWLDRLVTPASTEWFAFFYWSYFPLIAAWIVPVMLLERRARLLDELGLGLLLVVGTTHLLYMVVPGWGPYHAFAGIFPTPLPPGPWLDRVRDAVHAGGALKDIFPSLHTALPVYLTLFGFRHRRLRPYGAAWPPSALVTLNVVAAAVFLRWHYVVDVLAGLGLAAAVHLAAPRLAAREARRRADAGTGPVWPALGRAARAPAGGAQRAAAPTTSSPIRHPKPAAKLALRAARRSR